MGRWSVLAVAQLAGAALVWGQAQSNDVDVRAYLERAEQAEARGELQSARRELQEAVRRNPSEPEAHGRLGILYRKLGMPVQAAQSLEQAARLRPDPRVNVLLAFSYIDAGRYRDAIPLLASSFDTEEKDSVRSAIGQRLVECHLASGDDEKALAVMQKLRQIAPDDAAVLYLASKVYMNLWNGAFHRMVAKAPGSYQALLIQAEALEAQEKFAEAANEYRKVLRIAPRIGGIHYRLGHAILRSRVSVDADQEALDEFRKELEINPADVQALVAIGEIHAGRNRPQEATRSFEQAVGLQPAHVPARLGLAKTLIAEKQWSKALEHLEVARELAPDTEAVAYNLMIVYRGLGRPAEAQRAFETFQRLKERNQQSRTPAPNAVRP